MQFGRNVCCGPHRKRKHKHSWNRLPERMGLPSEECQNKVEGEKKKRWLLLMFMSPSVWIKPLFGDIKASTCLHSRRFLGLKRNSGDDLSSIVDPDAFSKLGCERGRKRAVGSFYRDQTKLLLGCTFKLLIACILGFSPHANLYTCRTACHLMFCWAVLLSQQSDTAAKPLLGWFVLCFFLFFLPEKTISWKDLQWDL